MNKNNLINLNANTKKIFLIAIIFCSICTMGISENVFAQTDISKAKETRESFVAEAHKHLGKPYRYGGVGADSFDCSGLVSYAARYGCNVNLPRMSPAIYERVEKISEGEIEVGDLFFFKTTGNGKVSHVGIYIGEGKFIHSASDGPKTGVIISSLSEKYWTRCYFASGRFLASAKEK